VDKVPISALTDLLLHKLSPAQAALLEDRIVQDGEVADLLEVATHDLIDDYAAARLDPEDARRVEEHVLATPDGPARVVFARALSQQQVKNAASIGRGFGNPHSPILPVALAASALIIAALVLLPGRDGVLRRAPTPPGTAAPEATRSRPSPNENGLADSVFTVALLSSQTRGAALPPVDIPSGASLVRIQCEIPPAGSDSRYHLTLKDEVNDTVLSLDALRSRQVGGIHFIEASIEASRLRPGRYRLTVYSDVHSAIPTVEQEFDLQTKNRN
jgi:hypothetical protein